jgi:Fic family protein
MYIRELPEWPEFRWNEGEIAGLVASVRHRQGRLMGRMEALGFDLREEAVLETLTADVVKSSDIEGEKLDPDQVRSSIARRLGMDIGAVAPADRNVEGIVEITLDATRHYSAPLTEDRLFAWHAALFPTGRSGMRRIIAGAWRDDGDGPMVVQSGPAGRERAHFEAPSASLVPGEMGRLLHWLDSQPGTDAVVSAAIAHLWFVTIHPFDDGNGRIARAISDMLLARSESTTHRFYSPSTQIRIEREDYYELLETTQKGSLDITRWLSWFLGCLERAIDGSESILGRVLTKARFWESHRQTPMNDRQRLIVNRMLDGFEGKLTTSKYAKLANCSPDTALRDIALLVERHVLVRSQAGGRSTSYDLK